MPKSLSPLKFILLVVLFCLLAISCSYLRSDNPSSLPAQKASTFKVALVLFGSHKDESWSQAGYEGLKLIEDKYKAQVDYTEDVSDSDAQKVMRKYAQENFDLIIAHSGGYVPAAEAVAKEFPRTKFAVVTTYPGNNRNLGAVAFRSGEVGYLTGMLAAMKTKTKKVAYMVGADYPVYKEEAALFERGVKTTNSSVQVSTTFMQNWTDKAKAAKLALNFIASGVDVLAINADEAGIGAIKAASQKPGVYVIGWTTDQYPLAPGRVLTSVLQDIPRLVLNAAILVQEGRWEGKLYKFGLKEKIYDFAPFRGMLTPEEEAVFQTARNQVINGEIDISF